MDTANFELWGQPRPFKRDGEVRVLVVDDNESARGAIAAYLTLEGMHVCAVAGYCEALSASADWKPDVAVLDIMMPVHDGFQTAQALRDRFDDYVGIVAFTATDSSFVKSHPASRFLFDGYCQKGTSPERLVRVLESLLANKAHRQSANSNFVGSNDSLAMNPTGRS
ncbi:response regulator [Paraburkholderia sabiae]|uniref:Response regulator n=1 Tax=Paraburkholderia sabiae TaxID=273251 RepID=A0ABU9QPP1_9BURK|nr:response regulator [Paraburkholderia sabiae]WJZ72258.1 response regulator [Paraburkholderia sabiae]CAD6562474.1 Response regulator MprA [Paraburkholderia sabiae]